MPRKSKIINVHPCDENHQVITVVRPAGKTFEHMHEPCAQCPWRKDSIIGAFPAEAYRHSAATCYDMAQTTFACHMAGSNKSRTCAGFLLSSGAIHNLCLRMAAMRGIFDWSAVTSSVALYGTYNDMAIANGVDPDDECLKLCR